MLVPIIPQVPPPSGFKFNFNGRNAIVTDNVFIGNGEVNDNGKFNSFHRNVAVSKTDDALIDEAVKSEAVATIVAIRSTWTPESEPNSKSGFPVPSDEWVNARLSEKGKEYTIASNTLATVVTFQKSGLSFKF